MNDEKASHFDSFSEALEIARMLNYTKTSWAFCGGIAVAVHGFIRATEDVDIIILAEELNVIDKELEKKGWIINKQPLAFKDGSQCFRRVKIQGSEHFILDLMIAPPGENYLEGKSEALFAGEKVYVISKEKLIKMKRKANRDKDIMDIEALTKGPQ